MKNRLQFPAAIRCCDFRISAGEVRAFRDGRMMALSWRADTKKKPLFMLTTGSSARPVNVHTRRGDVSKPVVVDLYNNEMNGVDVADQLTVFYSFICKTRKWWRKTFFWLLEVAMMNSYLLYKQSVSRPSHVEYRRAVINNIAIASIQLSSPCPSRGAPRRTTPNTLQRLDRKPHFMKKSAVDRDCVVCSVGDLGEDTGHYITAQPVTHICPDACFQTYHTRTNYRAT